MTADPQNGQGKVVKTMKIVVISPPRALSALLRRLFGIGKRKT
jgi:hypothetical protein